MPLVKRNGVKYYTPHEGLVELVKRELHKRREIEAGEESSENIKDKKIDLNKVKKLEFLQPNTQNIWLISTRPLSILKYTNYSMFPNYGPHKYSHKYSNIITDIDKFLKVIKDKSFRLIP